MSTGSQQQSADAGSGGKADELVHLLLDKAYSLPADGRGWFEHPTHGHIAHNVCTDAAAELSRLTAERDALKAEAEALQEAFVDTAEELGCEPDNEAMLLAIDALRKDAERYRWLKDNGIIRVFPVSSGAVSGNGTRILADTKDWLPGDFTYVIDGATRDVDAAIDAALAAQQRSENRNEGEKL